MKAAESAPVQCGVNFPSKLGWTLWWSKKLSSQNILHHLHCKGAN